MTPIEYKKQIVAACRRNLLESISFLEEEMKMLQESAAGDSEVGMSDRLESNDEEMMNERKDREVRRNLLYAELGVLDELETKETVTEVGMGAVVTTADHNFLISIARTFQVEDKAFIGLSTSAPVYTALEGKKAGETYSFNGVGVKIKEVF